MSDTQTDAKQVWIEESEIPASELVNKIRELARESNVQRIVVRNIYDEVMVDIPLPVGVFFGGMMMLFAPGLVGLGGIGILLSHVKMQVIRETETAEDTPTRVAMGNNHSQPYTRENDHEKQPTLNDDIGKTRVRPVRPLAEESGKTRVRVARPLESNAAVRTSVRVAPRQQREQDPPEITRVRTSSSHPQPMDEEEKQTLVEDEEA